MEVVSASKGAAQPDFSPQLLSMYYNRLFPYNQMYRWLSYGNRPGKGGTKAGAIGDSTFFQRREFSFTIEDDIYIRYQCFKDEKEMEEAMRKKRPHKIDIGAVFTLPPKDHSTAKPGAFRPLERELVFDIDLTDYDDVRKCCSGASICIKCWGYMIMACKVMDEGLRQDFGFKHLLWVYSGRRGVHLWVSDEEARMLSNEARSAVVEYFSVVAGNDNNTSKKVQLSSPIHPSLQRAYTILEPMFCKYICEDDGIGQGMLATPEARRAFLQTLPYEGVGAELDTKWQLDVSTAAEKWADIVEAVEAKALSMRGQGANSKRFKDNGGGASGLLKDPSLWKYEVVFEHSYPRLDINVSKSQNHLLKSPWAVHPKTGRVCVPFNMEQVESFDPFKVPTLGQLAGEIDGFEQADSPGGEGVSTVVSDVEKTSLKPYLEFFEQSHLTPLANSIRRKRREEREKEAAITGDF